MPVFNVRIEQGWGTDQFSNDFLVGAAAIGDAVSYGETFLAALNAAQFSVVYGIRLLVSPVPDPTRTGFVEVALTSHGVRDSSGATFAPFITCAEVKLSTSSGLPGAKLIRGAIHSSDLTVEGELQTLHGSSLAALNTCADMLATFITANPDVILVGAGHRSAIGASANTQAVNRKPDNKWHNRHIATP